MKTIIQASLGLLVMFALSVATPVQLSAQCAGFSCDGNDSCGQSGSLEDCSVGCWDDEVLGPVCVCTGEPCMEVSLNDDFRTLETRYSGLGRAIPAASGALLIEGCNGQVMGVAYTIAEEKEVKEEQRSLVFRTPLVSVTVDAAPAEAEND